MGNVNQRTITATQYAVLQENITSDNRVGFYTNLYKFTGSENALLMAKISSSSDVIGGIAWALNTEIKKEHPSLYPAGGIASYSRIISIGDFGLIKNNPTNPAQYFIPSEKEMLIGAHKIWVDNKLGNLFPGLPLLGKSEAMDGNISQAYKHFTDFQISSNEMRAALKELPGFVIDDPKNFGKSLQTCLNQNPDATTRTFTAYNRDITEVISKDGKTVCVFDKSHGLPGTMQDIQVNPMGDVINTTFNQASDGKYILDTRDLYGSYRRDIYDLSGATPYLDKTDITLKAADGTIAHGIYDLNANGSVQNQQIILTNPAGKTTATFIGKDNVGTVEHADIKLAENSSSIITGEGNTVTPMGDGVWAHFNGSDLQVNATKPMTIGFSGLRETFTGEGSTVWLNAGTEGGVIGTNNTVVLNGSGNYAEITGSNINVNALTTGQRIGLTGDNQRVTATGSDVWFHAGSDGALIGDHNTMVANGTDVQAFIYGSDSLVVSKAAGNTVTLNGERETVSAVDNNIWFAGSSNGGVFGDKNHVVANGQNIQMAVVGSDTLAISPNAGNTITMQGDRVTVGATGNNVWFAPGTDGGVFGDKNHVVANGQNIQMAVVGSDTMAISPNAGNTITMQGDRVTVSAKKNDVWFAPGTDGGVYGSMNNLIANGTDIQMFAQGDLAHFISNFGGNTYTYSGRWGDADVVNSAFWAMDSTVAIVRGNGNLIVANGISTELYAYGDNVTYQGTFPGQSFTGGGKNMTIKGDNQKLSFDKGTTATIYGHNNVILQNDASNLLRFVDEPFRNVPAANVSTPSTLPTYHPSSSPIQIGQLTLFSNFDAFNTGRSSGVLHLSDWSDIESGFF